MSDAQKVKAKIDIVDVIGEFVQLKRAGRNFKGNCPFHNEKTPSFMVNPELQIYKCFGCNESGDAFTFLQKHEGLEFYEALQILAKRAGVELKEFKREENSEKERLKQANFEAARFYNYILLKHRNGKQALDYLLKKRKLSLDTIKQFNIGFAPDDWSPLFDYLTKKKNFKFEEVEKAGLSYKGRKGYVDRFRGRIVFPINDHRGSTIALAGRILDSNLKLAKYINSPETLIYKKSYSLYGIDKAKHEIKKTGTAILTEGELDMLSTFQAGFKNVVAIKGTAVTEEQVHLISRFAKIVIMALDADFAGDKAALRGITLAQNQNLEIKVADMGENKDPDDFAKADPKGYKKSLTEAQDVWDYLIHLTSEKYDLTSGVEKAKASKFLLPFLEKLTDSVMREHYIQEFARKISINPSVLRNQMRNKRYEFKSDVKTDPSLKENATLSRRMLLEQDVLRIGVNYLPEKLKEVSLEIFSNKKIIRILSLYKKQKNDLKDFVNSLPAEVQDFFKELIFTDSEENKPEEAFNASLRELQILDVKEKIKKTASKISEFEEKRQSNKLEKSKKEFKKLTQKLNTLEE